MKTLFLVTRAKGRAWNAAKPMRSQEQWAEHATFMDQLAADGFVVLGGPLGESSDVLLIVDAPNESEIHAKLSRDPWSQSGILDVQKIQRWTVLLESGNKA